METVWVLERAYRLPRIQISEALLALVCTGSLVVEAADDVARCAFSYGRGRAGFSDLMILSAGQSYGYSPLYTFDRALARVEGATLLKNYSGG